MSMNYIIVLCMRLCYAMCQSVCSGAAYVPAPLHLDGFLSFHAPYSCSHDPLGNCCTVAKSYGMECSIMTEVIGGTFEFMNDGECRQVLKRCCKRTFNHGLDGNTTGANRFEFFFRSFHCQILWLNSLVFWQI